MLDLNLTIPRADLDVQEQQRVLIENFSLINDMLGRDFFFRVINGEIPGYQVEHRSGHGVVGSAKMTVWPRNCIYTPSITANIREISSSAAADAGKTFFVQGLDTDWNVQKFNVTLDAVDGRTTVDWVTAGYGPALRSLCILEINDTVSAVGDVYCYVAGASVTAGVPSVDSEVRAMLQNGNGRALQALCTIPADYEGFIYLDDAGCASGKDVELSFNVHVWNGSSYNASVEKHHIDIYQSPHIGNLNFCFKLEEKTFFDIRADSSGTGAAVSAGFWILLKQKTQL